MSIEGVFWPSFFTFVDRGEVVEEDEICARAGWGLFPSGFVFEGKLDISVVAAVADVGSLACVSLTDMF